MTSEDPDICSKTMIQSWSIMGNPNKFQGLALCFMPFSQGCSLTPAWWLGLGPLVQLGFRSRTLTSHLWCFPDLHHPLISIIQTNNKRRDRVSLLLWGFLIPEFSPQKHLHVSCSSFVPLEAKLLDFTQKVKNWNHRGQTAWKLISCYAHLGNWLSFWKPLEVLLLAAGTEGSKQRNRAWEMLYFVIFFSHLAMDVICKGGSGMGI